MDLIILAGGTILALAVIAAIDLVAGRHGPTGGAPAASARGAAANQRLTTLRDGLRGTRDLLAGGIALALGRQDERRFEQLEEVLIGADVGIATARALVAQVRREVGPRGDDPAVMNALRGCMLSALRVGGPRAEPDVAPFVVLVTGVNGVGKTTTVAKLAARHRAAGRRVLMVAADTFRAAAADQLEAWGQRLGVDVVRHREGGTPAAVVFDGMAAALARAVDVVLVDTAGRLHTRKPLLEELRKVRRVIIDAVGRAPQETLLVLDATTGQNALNQARTFTEAVEPTGVVLTKLDGTARGGIALAIAQELGLPIRDVGIGERESDLRPFDAEEFVTALLGPSPGPAGASSELQP